MCSVYIYVIVLQWNDTTHYISAAAYPSWSWNSCETYEDKFYYGFWLVGGFMPRCLNREVQWKREHRPVFCKKKAYVKKTVFEDFKYAARPHSPKTLAYFQTYFQMECLTEYLLNNLATGRTESTSGVSYVTTFKCWGFKGKAPQIQSTLPPHVVKNLPIVDSS